MNIDDLLKKLKEHTLHYSEQDAAAMCLQDFMAGLDDLEARVTSLEASCCRLGGRHETH